MPKKVGELGVRRPLCFLRADGDNVALLGIGERTIGRVVFSCGMFNWEDEGREKTIVDGYRLGDSAGVTGSEIPLG